MRTYVAMIRGINVGGSKRVSMGDLRALFEALGAEDVRTYVQSGNVVFRSAGKSPATLAKAIEDQVGEVLDLDVRVVVRTGKELAEIVGKNPFLEDGKDRLDCESAFQLLRNTLPLRRGSSHGCLARNEHRKRD